MCLTKFVYEAAERGILTTQEELITLITLRNLKAEAGYQLPPYSSSKHEDSELYEWEPENLKVDEDETELLPAECFSSTDRPSRSNSWTGGSSKLILLTDEDIAVRIQDGITAAFSIISLPLMLILARVQAAHRNSRDLSMKKR